MEVVLQILEPNPDLEAARKWAKNIESFCDAGSALPTLFSKVAMSYVCLLSA